MRYLFIGVILLAFIGCGSSSKKDNGGDTIVTPASPKTTDSNKQPPAIPNI